MEREFFSLLWDREEYYEEWLQDITVRDGEYIFDLNLEYIYDEVRMWGNFGNQYDFREVFLYSCIRSSTIEYRHRIMEHLLSDSRLYEAALEVVACVSDTQKKLKRVFGTRDEVKKEIFFLQMLYEFFFRMEEVYAKLEEQALIVPETSIAAGIRKLGEVVAGYEAEQRKERLVNYLRMLHRDKPAVIVLNKGENQVCHSAVVCPAERVQLSFTDRLKAAASFFLEDYEYSVRVYQDMDITHLDKKLQEHLCRQQPKLARDTKELYESYKEFDFQLFNQLANELTFYLSCISFRRQYEKQGFYFVMPVCQYGKDTKVEEAYDMMLAVNLFRKDKGALMVSNDFNFDSEGRMFFLTGANQGGKTTFLRSVGLVQHLAQIGMFVPAREAAIGLVGHIHTHFSRGDEKTADVGRFEQELERMKKVVERLENGDMVLLNESFSSTQRMKAVMLLCQLLREFNRRNCVGGLVTHYHEISDMLKGSSFYSLVAGVSKEGEDMGRTFKIVRAQPYRQSYAKDIASRCGVTYEQLVRIIESAEESEDGDVLF